MQIKKKMNPSAALYIFKLQPYQVRNDPFVINVKL